MNDNFAAAPLSQMWQGHLWLLQQQEEHTHWQRPWVSGNFFTIFVLTIVFFLITFSWQLFPRSILTDRGHECLVTFSQSFLTERGHKYLVTFSQLFSPTIVLFPDNLFLNYFSLAKATSIQWLFSQLFLTERGHEYPVTFSQSFSHWKRPWVSGDFFLTDRGHEYRVTLFSTFSHK